MFEGLYENINPTYIVIKVFYRFHIIMLFYASHSGSQLHELVYSTYQV